jgi:hypothetical protein
MEESWPASRWVIMGPLMHSSRRVVERPVPECLNAACSASSPRIPSHGAAASPQTLLHEFQERDRLQTGLDQSSAVKPPQLSDTTDNLCRSVGAERFPSRYSQKRGSRLESGLRRRRGGGWSALTTRGGLTGRQAPREPGWGRASPGGIRVLAASTEIAEARAMFAQIAGAGGKDTWALTPRHPKVQQHHTVRAGR